MHEYRPDETPHSVKLEGRQRCTISGVLEVISFDEDELVMETARGTLTIGGSGLHVERLSLDVGELTVEGQIDALVYAEEKPRGKGLWGRFF